MTFKLPKAAQRKADVDLLAMLGIDTSRLTDAEIRQGGEAARRISQCEQVAGSCQRRPAAVTAWEAFRAKHRSK